MNFCIDEFNQYINGLEAIVNFNNVNNIANTTNSTSTNSSNLTTISNETDSRFMVNFLKTMEFTKNSLEKDCENNAEFYQFKKEVEILREDDPKTHLKSGIIDYDMFMSRYLPFYRKIKNLGKRHLVLAFKSADLNNDGLINLFEFGLILKFIEKEFFMTQQIMGVQKIFQDNSDIIINQDEKHLSFNNFCSLCEEFYLFDIKKTFKYIEIVKEEEGNKKFKVFHENYETKKKKLLAKISTLKNVGVWEEVLEKLQQKLEKALNDEKMKIPALISFKLIEEEIEETKNKEIMDIRIN